MYTAEEARTMNPIRKLKTFYEEVAGEIKRCTWPNRTELMESTVLVLVAVAMLTSFIWGVDFVAQKLIRWLIMT